MTHVSNQYDHASETVTETASRATPVTSDTVLPEPCVVGASLLFGHGPVTLHMSDGTTVTATSDNIHSYPWDMSYDRIVELHDILRCRGVTSRDPLRGPRRYA